MSTFWRRHAAVVACAAFIVTGSIAQGRQDSASIIVRGRVSSAIKLSQAGEPSDRRARVEMTGPDSAELLLTGDGGDEALSISFEVRTNVAYEMKLSLISSEGCLPELRASVVGVEATGAAVVRRAAEESRASESVALSKRTSEQTLIAGPRVSARGNFTSPGNALRFDLELEPAAGAACDWQARLAVRVVPRVK